MKKSKRARSSDRLSKKHHGAYERGSRGKASPKKSYVRYYTFWFDPATGFAGLSGSDLEKKEAVWTSKLWRERGMKAGIIARSESLPEPTVAEVFPGSRPRYNPRSKSIVDSWWAR